MGLRGLGLVAAALGVVGATGAWAGPAVPAPSATVVTYLPDGTKLPVSGVSADWSGVQPGCSGTLRATGAVASGTTTVVNGQFASRTYRPRQGRLLSIGFSQNGREVLQPKPEKYVASFRVRAVGHRWSPWLSLGLTTEPTRPAGLSLLYSSSSGAGIEVAEAASRPGHRLPLQQVQIRFRAVLTSTGRADDAWTVHLGC